MLKCWFFLLKLFLLLKLLKFKLKLTRAELTRKLPQLELTNGWQRNIWELKNSEQMASCTLQPINCRKYKAGFKRVVRIKEGI